MFYSTSQNNSGGGYIQDKNVDQIVIVEADSAKEAEEYLGKLIDDNSYNESSCPCCGDHFYVFFEEDEGSSEPKSTYGEPLIVDSLEGFDKSYRRFAVIHYKNGTKKRYDRLDKVWDML